MISFSHEKNETKWVKMMDKISSWHVFLTYGLLCDTKVSYLIDRKIAKRFLFASNMCGICSFLLVLRGDMQSVPSSYRYCLVCLVC